MYPLRNIILVFFVIIVLVGIKINHNNKTHFKETKSNIEKTNDDKLVKNIDNIRKVDISNKVKSKKYKKLIIEKKDKRHKRKIKKHYIKCIYANSRTKFKAYMGYHMITAKSSPQYKMKRNGAYTGMAGIRKVKDRYCAAVGSGFCSVIGTKFDVILKNGVVIKCILADQKANRDTTYGSGHKLCRDGSVLEFVVDYARLSRTIRRMGDASYANTNWHSPVKYIAIV